MNAIFRTLVLLVPFTVLACQSSAPESGEPAASGPAPEQPSAATPAEKIGVFTALECERLALWPEAHAGSLLVLEVAPQGQSVQKGDVVARLDTRVIDEEIRRAEVEVRSSEVSRSSTVEKGRLEEEAARSALERARASLERARRSLAGWKEQELAFARRADDLSRRYEQADLEDQIDELDQLEKMYGADELVDATEDIVLKRSRRSLALTQEQNQLSRDRASYHEELELALQTEQREEEFRAQTEALARLEQQQAIEARGRAEAELRAAELVEEQTQKLARLRRDRELFTLAAPCAGILLHGDPEEYRPGKSPARYERGSQLPLRADVFAIAPAEPAAVAFEIPDSELGRFREGMRVEVRLLSGAAAGAAEATQGRLRVDPYARSLSADETRLAATVVLDRPLAGVRHGQRARVIPSAPEQP